MFVDAPRFCMVCVLAISSRSLHPVAFSPGGWTRAALERSIVRTCFARRAPAIHIVKRPIKMHLMYIKRAAFYRVQRRVGKCGTKYVRENVRAWGCCRSTHLGSAHPNHVRACPQKEQNEAICPA